MRQTLFCLFLILSHTALAGLDEAREKSYQAALLRYGDGRTTEVSASPANIRCLPAQEKPSLTAPFSAPKLTQRTEHSATVRTSEDSVYLNSIENIYWESKSEEDRLRITAAQTDWTSISSGQFNYGQSVHQSIYSKIVEPNANHIIVTSYVTANTNDLYGESLTAQHRVDSTFEDIRILYLGNIQFDTYSSNIDSSVSIIKTSNFDPCLLEQSATATLKYQQEKLLSQGRVDFKVNCMITKKLSGELITSFIFTNEEGKLIKKIDLSGELTYRVSDAISIKYSAHYINGRDPLNINSFESFSTGLNEQTDQPTFLTQSDAAIGNIYFTKKELDEGRLHQFSLEQTRTGSNNCQISESFNLGQIESSVSNQPIFSVRHSRLCRETSEESGGRQVTTGLSFGNTLATDDSLPAPVLSYSKTIESQGKSTSFEFTTALIEDDINIFEFNVENLTINPNGQRHNNSFRAVHLKNESYVVLEQVLIFPVLTDQARLQLQAPAQSPCQGGQARANTSLIDPRLCQKINCSELGVALSFTNQGGVFLTARGKTFADVFGRDFEISIIAGVPLNSMGQNKSWGAQNLYYYSYTPSSGEPDNPFLEFSLSPEDCSKNQTQFCTEFSFRVEEDSNSFGFGSVLKF